MLVEEKKKNSTIFYTSKISSRDLQHFLSHYSQVSETCGYIVEEDRLRIPSTKRICFVGRHVTYTESEREATVSRIRQLIGEGDGDNDAAEDSEPGTKKAKVTADDVFVPRPADIKVRNCTRVDRGLTAEIVSMAVDKCLEEENMLETDSGMKWNQGRAVPLSDLASLVPPDKLKALKSECGGLQTLLRNHNHIFMVRGGTFRLRCLATDELNPGRNGKNKKNVRVKAKLCWFHDNHPQGCCIEAVKCPYAHGKEDMVDAT